MSIRFGSDNDLVPCTCVRLCTVCIVYIYFACWCGCSALAICVRVVCMLTHHMVSNIQYRYVHVNMLEYVWFGGEQMCNTRVVHLLKHWAVYVHCLLLFFGFGVSGRGQLTQTWYQIEIQWWFVVLHPTSFGFWTIERCTCIVCLCIVDFTINLFMKCDDPLVKYVPQCVFVLVIGSCTC